MDARNVSDLLLKVGGSILAAGVVLKLFTRTEEELDNIISTINTVGNKIDKVTYILSVSDKILPDPMIDKEQPSIKE
jgi:uncharacterized protein YaaN involved in tellurite resistance